MSALKGPHELCGVTQEALVSDSRAAFKELRSTKTSRTCVSAHGGTTGMDIGTWGLLDNGHYCKSDTPIKEH